MNETRTGFPGIQGVSGLHGLPGTKGFPGSPGTRCCPGHAATPCRGGGGAEGHPSLRDQGSGKLPLGAAWVGAPVLPQTEKGFSHHEVWGTEAAWPAEISAVNSGSGPGSHGTATVALLQISLAQARKLTSLLFSLPQVRTPTATPASLVLPGTGVTQESPTPAQALSEPQDRKGSEETQVRPSTAQEHCLHHQPRAGVCESER